MTERSQINSLQKEIKNDIVEEENKNWDKKIENINNLKTNPAKSWKEIQYVLQTNKKQNRKQIDHVIDSNGTKITDKNDITETFRQKLMNTLQPNEVTDVHHNNQIKNFIDNYKIDTSDLLPFANCEVLNKIKKLKTNKAPGVDQINNKTLLYLSETISPILTKLFNSCLGVGYFPTAFKVAKVTMIPKKGVSKSIDNFRPISLLSTIGKLFESVIASRIYNWAENHEKINPEQSGFRKRRSTNDQLFLLTQAVRQNFNRKRQTDAVFIDFAKAFDKVWHEGLRYKLHRIGVPFFLQSILSSFLENRRCFISLHGMESAFFTPAAGVPQGSCISPILFSLYAADIPMSLKCFTSQFADDIAIWHSPHKRSPRNELQLYFNDIIEWCDKWGLKINHTKTHKIIFIHSHMTATIKQPILFKTVPIPVVNEVTFLGIRFDSRLNFNNHLDNICNSTISIREKLHHLSFTSPPINKSILRSIYMSNVRSRLEYGCTALSTLTRAQYNRMNIIQNSCVRSIYSLPRGTRKEQILSIANLTSIEDRILFLGRKHITQALQNPIHPISLNQDTFRFFINYDMHQTPFNRIHTNHPITKKLKT